MSSKTHVTAVAIIPPLEVWEPIQAIRHHERLTIRHEAGASSAPYVHGTLLAVRRVMLVAGLVRGLDRLLFEYRAPPPA